VRSDCSRSGARKSNHALRLRDPGRLACVLVRAVADSRSEVDRLLNSAPSRLGLFRAVDRAYVLALATVGQAVEGRAGDPVGAESACEVGRRNDDARLNIEFDLDLYPLTDCDASGSPVGIAEPEQEAAAHDRDPAPPGMSVDRDDHRRPFAFAGASTTSGGTSSPLIGDLLEAPNGAVLLAQQDKLALGEAGLPAGVVEEHQREQPVQLGLIGHQLRKRTSESSRLVGALSAAT